MIGRKTSFGSGSEQGARLTELLYSVYGTLQLWGLTNNLAAQDLRRMKLRMKSSGCFRTEQGARDFATLRSVLSTARQQGRHAIEALLTPRTSCSPA